ncbi:MAG: hypothetical protein JSV64_03025 [Candidatus Bathyarchaeota archaeon]|nr:MAG: hypothetical protein JSV64_03025 [Candidatus Bathyarchaeota archaeon]
MGIEDARPRLQAPIERYTPLGANSRMEETKKHRFSALVNGICIGVGMIFILLGAIMPLTSADMLVQGLLSIIGGLVATVIGVVVEVYNWAQLR